MSDKERQSGEEKRVEDPVLPVVNPELEHKPEPPKPATLHPAFYIA
jgi:hypothetical protein